MRNAFAMAPLDRYSEFEHLERILLDAVCDEPIIYDNAVSAEPARSEKYQKYQTEKYIPKPHYERGSK